MLSSLRVRYLLDWAPDQDPALSKLLIGLKNGRSILTWRRFAEAFLIHHASRLDLMGVALIPIPSKSGHLDHARGWAEGLSQVTGLPVVDLLQASGIQSQKLLSKRERKQVRFQSLSIATNHHRFVIVDDIFTTGATTRAAHSALLLECNREQPKPPEIVEIWTLAHRSRLAP